MFTIKLTLTDVDQVVEWPLFDSTDPDGRAVYLIKDYPDGSIKAFNKAYEFIGIVSSDDFASILPFVIQSDPSYTGGEDHVAADAYWFDTDEHARKKQIAWTKERSQEKQERDEESSLR